MADRRRRAVGARNADAFCVFMHMQAPPLVKVGAADGCSEVQCTFLAGSSLSSCAVAEVETYADQTEADHSVGEYCACRSTYFSPTFVLHPSPPAPPTPPPSNGSTEEYVTCPDDTQACAQSEPRGTPHGGAVPLAC